MRAARKGGLLLAALSAVVIAACSQGQGPSGVPGGTVTAVGTPGADEYDNPVIAADFPDPGVLKVDGDYFAYATGDPRVDPDQPRETDVNIQVASSNDLVAWSQTVEALPELPSWSEGLIWAPEVWQVDQHFVMYYTARFTDGGRQCISVAVADDPAGPFLDDSDEPLVCQLDLGGSIDPFPLLAGDTRYLLWKNDGNCCGHPTRIWAQELTDDGLALAADEPVDLGIRNDASWEGDLIEAPTVIEHGGSYYLFFSANFFESASYAVGYAKAEEALGPYTDADENPILATPAGVAGWPGDRPAGPGGQAIVADSDGRLWILYHAWDLRSIGYHAGGARTMWVDELVFEDGRPVVFGPDDGPQAAP